MAFSTSEFKLEGTATTFGQSIRRQKKDSGRVFFEKDVAKIPGQYIPVNKTVNLQESKEVENLDFTKQNLAILLSRNDSSVIQPGITDEAESDVATVLGSDTMSEEDRKTLLQESLKVDSLIGISSDFSEIVEANCLEEVELTGEFVYNFYDALESDIQYQETSALNFRNIFDIPKYIKLSWNPARVRNIQNLNEDFEKNQKQYPNLIETSKKEDVFNYIANKDVFKNTISALLEDKKESESFSADGGKFFINNDVGNSFLRSNFSYYGFSFFHDLGFGLESIKIPREKNKSTISHIDLSGFSYFGYIIEKERYVPSSGNWVRVDDIKIIGSKANTFIDTNIAYGNVYRYRIKSILKATTKKNIKNNSDALSDNDIKNIINEQEQNIIKEKEAFLKNLSFLVESSISSSTSKGNKPKSVALANQVTSSIKEVQLLINKGYSVVDFIKKNKSSEIAQILEQVKKAFIDIERQNRKDIYTSSYYCSYPSKEWSYYFVEESIPPPWPQTVKFVPNTPKRQIFISWANPSNEQRDIRFIKIYRKTGFNEPWKELVKREEFDVDGDSVVDAVERESGVIEPGSNFFDANKGIFIDKLIDTDPPKDNISEGVEKKLQKGTARYIYALTSVDVHGLESFLSIQTIVELNSNYDIEKEEKPLKMLSAGGMAPSESGFINKFYDRKEAIVARKVDENGNVNVRVSVADEFIEPQKSFIIKITSLDTHESKEIKVVVKNEQVSE